MQNDPILPLVFFKLRDPYSSICDLNDEEPTGFSRLLLQLASPQLREDVEVVEAAVKQNPDVIRSLDAQSRASGQ